MDIKEISDIGVILPLHMEIFGKEFPIKSYYKKIQNNNLYIFVYEYESMLIGYSIIVDEEEQQNMYAWYGGVLPQFQGKGITLKFLHNLIELAIENEYKSVTLASTNVRPHMLRLAIKMGFDIDDLKKRDYGEGNKIYFRYRIFPAHSEEIALTENGEALKLVKIEEKLVQAYKTNCVSIKFSDITEDDTIIYAIKYCESFSRKIDLILKMQNHISSSSLIEAVKGYSGKIKII